MAMIATRKAEIVTAGLSVGAQYDTRMAEAESWFGVTMRYLHR